MFLVLWAGGYPAAKLGLLYAGPLTILVLRFILVLVVLIPLVAMFRPGFPTTAARWGHLIVIGLLIQGVYCVASNSAFATGMSAGTMAVIMALQPIIVALLAPGFAGEHVGWLRWMGLLLGLAGATIVIVSRSSIDPPTAYGLIATLAALFGLTAATLYERKTQVHEHPLVSNIVQYIVGLIVVLPVAWLIEPFEVDWTMPFVGSLAYLVLGNSLVAITLLLAMIRYGEASRVSALFFLVPPLAAIFAWLVLGEHMPFGAWIGMAVAAVGVTVATRAGRSPPATGR